ncbi:MAG TPA: thiamine pyrophosphate-requiring protein [Chloroflexota bacterium]|nr:thiamine pyrophosphate-requiring protein [Chloroflexota bacterium]
MQGSIAVASILKQEAVEQLFCLPINPLIEACAELRIRPYMARTERHAIGMADGFSRVTNGRRIGVCASQYGPGAENSFGGIAQVYSDSTPVLYLPAGPNQARLGVANTFDITSNFRNITKYAARINSAGRIPEFMRRAFTYMRAGRPGPVALEVPVDVMAAQLDDLVYSPVERPLSMAAPSAVAAAVKAIVAAKKPIIHAGVGILYAEAWDELQEFAELVQAPVMTTVQGKSAFREDHPLSLGAAAQAGSMALARYLAEADLIFGAGSGLATSAYDAPIPKGRVAVQLTVDERDFNSDYAVQYMLQGDAKLVLQQMIDEARRQLGKDGRKGDGKVAAAIKAIKDAWMAEYMPKLTDNETPMNPYRVIWEVQHAVDLRNTVATHDAGSPRDMMVPFWPALEPNSYIGWGKSTHLGYGLPMAMGVKVAKPEKTVLNVMGDLAFGMSGLELETAARNHIGTITILFNNGLLGGYDKHLHVSTELYGTRYITGNYSKIAEGLGAYSERVEKPEEIAGAVKRAMKANGDGKPALLEMMTREETKLSKYW